MEATFSQGHLFAAQRSRQEEAQLQALMQSIGASIGTPPPEEWTESPYSRFKARSPTVTGSMFERLVEAWLRSYGVDVQPRTDPGHDRVISGEPVEIKGATICPNGTFVFNQIRDQPYKAIILLGLEPQAAHMWVEDKADARRIGRNQHAAGPETKMLIIGPGWLGPSSDGSLTQALSRLTSL